MSDGSREEQEGSGLVRIVLADDNPAARNYLRSLLEQQPTWKVCYQAPTGREALQWISEHPPDVVLLDFQMPDLNGLEVARQMALLSPEIPILMITIHPSKQLGEEARKTGIRGLCAKWDVGSIVEAVEALLRRGTYFPEASAARQ
ncbi:MAG TPA: response regulator transcription factor [Terriglobales bacterium]|nr:response regulator transcription factor [Terriglobales bacterium]